MRLSPDIKEDLFHLFSKYDEILAVWHEHDLSNKYNQIMLMVIYEKSDFSDSQLLKHNLNMDLIDVEAKYNCLIDFCLRSNIMSPKTPNEEQEEDYILRINGFTSDGRLYFESKDDVVNTSKYDKHKIIHDIIEDNPQLVVKLHERHLARINSQEQRTHSYAYEDEWEKMLRVYPIELLLKFIVSTSPKFQAAAISSPLFVF